MIRPAQYDLIVSRWQPLVWSVMVAGVDLSALDCSFEARPYPDGNVAWLQLPKGAGANNVSASVAQFEGLPATIFTVKASKASLGAIPFPAASGTELVGSYGLKIGGMDYLVGRFTLPPRANHG